MSLEKTGKNPARSSFWLSSFVLIFFILIGSCNALTFEDIRSSLFHSHRSEYQRLLSNLETCQVNSAHIEYNITTYQGKVENLEQEVEAIKQIYINLQVYYNATHDSLVDEAHEQLKLLESIKQHVSTLESQTEANQIMPLLHLIEERVRSKIEDGFQSRLSPIAAKIQEKEQELRNKEYVYENNKEVYQLLNLELEQTLDLCDAKQLELESFKEQMVAQYGLQAPNYIPKGPQLGIAFADGQNRFFTVDGKQIEVPEPGEYVLFETGDGHSQAHVRYSRFGQGNTSSPIILTDVAVHFSLFEDSVLVQVSTEGNLVVNGEEVELPYILHGFEIAKQTNSGAFEVVVPTGIVLIIQPQPYPNEFVKSLTAMFPRKSFFKNTHGLVGFFDDLPQNDLLTPDSQIISGDGAFETFFSNWTVGNAASSEELLATVATGYYPQVEGSLLPIENPEPADWNQGALCHVDERLSVSSFNGQERSIHVEEGTVVLAKSKSEDFVVQAHIQKTSHGFSTITGVAVQDVGSLVVFSLDQESNIEVKINGNRFHPSEQWKSISGGAQIRASFSGYELQMAFGQRVYVSSLTSLLKTWIFVPIGNYLRLGLSVCGSYDNDFSKNAFEDSVVSHDKNLVPKQVDLSQIQIPEHLNNAQEEELQAINRFMNVSWVHFTPFLKETFQGQSDTEQLGNFTLFSKAKTWHMEVVGDDSHAVIPVHREVSFQEFTVSFWVDFAAASGNGYLVASKDFNEETHWNIPLVWDEGEFSLGFKTNHTSILSRSISPNRWNHVSVSMWQGKSAMLYLNGELAEFSINSSNLESLSSVVQQFKLTLGEGMVNARFKDIRLYDHSIDKWQAMQIFKDGFLHCSRSVHSRTHIKLSLEKEVEVKSSQLEYLVQTLESQLGEQQLVIKDKESQYNSTVDIHNNMLTVLDNKQHEIDVLNIQIGSQEQEVARKRQECKDIVEKRKSTLDKELELVEIVINKVQTLQGSHAELNDILVLLQTIRDKIANNIEVLLEDSDEETLPCHSETRSAESKLDELNSELSSLEEERNAISNQILIQEENKQSAKSVLNAAQEHYMEIQSTILEEKAAFDAWLETQKDTIQKLQTETEEKLGDCVAGGEYRARYGKNLFHHTGIVQIFEVPSGVRQISAKLWGAAGGNGGGYGSLGQGTGGAGGFAAGTLAVTPGELLYVYVGGGGRGAPSRTSGGAGGWNGGGNGGNGSGSYPAGGGGGGATDIRQGGTTLSHRVIVAGGGGGASGSNAGAGGGTTGQSSGSHGNASSARGGSQTSGGAAGTCFLGSGTRGQFGAGGNGRRSSNTSAGGGGGAGWYGGGGGANNRNQGSGGGGGSSKVPTGGATLGGNLQTPPMVNDEDYVSGVAHGPGRNNRHANGAHGMVVISWEG